MATITLQVVETGQTTATKTYTLPDAHIDRVVVAYQAAGNAAIGGTATRGQVLATWADILIKQNTVTYVANIEQQAVLNAVVPVSPITPV